MDRGGEGTFRARAKVAKASNAGRASLDRRAVEGPWSPRASLARNRRQPEECDRRHKDISFWGRAGAAVRSLPRPNRVSSLSRRGTDRGGDVPSNASPGGLAALRRVGSYVLQSSPMEGSGLQPGEG
jgi:hypothetical protein